MDRQRGRHLPRRRDRRRSAHRHQRAPVGAVRRRRPAAPRRGARAGDDVRRVSARARHGGLTDRRHRHHPPRAVPRCRGRHRAGRAVRARPPRRRPLRRDRAARAGDRHARTRLRAAVRPAAGRTPGDAYVSGADAARRARRRRAAGMGVLRPRGRRLHRPVADRESRVARRRRGPRAGAGAPRRRHPSLGARARAARTPPARAVRGDPRGGAEVTRPPR